MDFDRLLRPRSLALVGLSETGVFGANLVRSIERAGYPGKLYPVNPSRKEIFGRPCYPSLASLPQRPDAAVLMVSAARTAAVLRECAEQGIRAATIIASGFAELQGPEGRARQDELTALARAADIAICGPNCNGFFNVLDRLPCFTGPLYRFPRPGNVGLVSQSGATISSFVDEAFERNLGFTFLISSGNEAIFDTVDYLDFLLADEQTRVLAAFLESVRRPAAFLDLARRAAQVGKPLIVVKLGRSARSRESALAHTGALAGSDRAFEAAFKHWGVIRAVDVSDLLDRCQLLSQVDPEKWPRGRRLGFMSVSGGAVGLLGDLGETRGVELPDLRPETAERLAASLPIEAVVRNPFDMTGQIHAVRDRFADMVESFLAEPDFDAVAVNLHCEADYEFYLREMEATAARSDKPLVLTTTGAIAMTDWGRSFLAEHRLPVVLGIGRLLDAFRAAADYRAFRERQVLAPSEEHPAPGPGGRAALASLPADSGILGDEKTWGLLEAFDLPHARVRFAGNAEQALAAADALGYPVVLKALAEGLAHRSDVGGVALGLRDADELSRAYAGVTRRVAETTGRPVSGALVQEMVRDGVEAYIGAIRSDEFGPLVLVGLGGVFVEVLGDVVARLAPVDHARAAEMLAELKGRKLLDGVRGKPPADVGALVDLVVRVSRLAAALGERLSELDLNPVIVRPRGEGARIVDALLVLKPG